MSRVRHATSPRAIRPARHSSTRVSHRLRHVVGLITASVLVFGVSGFASGYIKLQGNIQGADVEHLLGDHRPTVVASTEGNGDPTDPFGGQAVNILLLGSDSRSGDNTELGGEYDGMRADTTMLVHVAADRSRVDVVSIPRDTMVDIPSCTRMDGSVSKSQFGMFNSAFAIGGQNDDVPSAAACAQKTVESISGIRIDGYVVVDMLGFRSVIDTLGGIDLCIPKAIDLPDQSLVLDQGMQHLDGWTALMYARERHNLGDGSDLQRIDRQKVVMGAVAQKAMSSNLLTNPAQTLQFLNATTQTLNVSEAFSSLTSLAGFGFSLRHLEMSNIAFMTAPYQAYPKDKNRVQLADSAHDLFALLASDQPVPGTPAWQQIQDAAAAAAAAAAQANPPAAGTDTDASGTDATGADATGTDVTGTDTSPTADAPTSDSSGSSGLQIDNPFKASTEDTTCG